MEDMKARFQDWKIEEEKETGETYLDKRIRSTKLPNLPFRCGTGTSAYRAKTSASAGIYTARSSTGAGKRGSTSFYCQRFPD